MNWYLINVVVVLIGMATLYIYMEGRHRMGSGEHLDEVDAA